MPPLLPGLKRSYWSILRNHFRYPVHVNVPPSALANSLTQNNLATAMQGRRRNQNMERRNQNIEELMSQSERFIEGLFNGVPRELLQNLDGWGQKVDQYIASFAPSQWRIPDEMGLIPGTHIYWRLHPGTDATHSEVYIGNGLCVGVHGTSVHIASLEHMLRRGIIFNVRMYGPGESFDRPEIVRRAMTLIGPYNFCLATANCEDFATYACTGVWASKQVIQTVKNPSKWVKYGSRASYPR